MVKGKIIVADSKFKSRIVLREVLARNGYNVVAEVSNVPELLRKARKLYPDLVIVDADIEGGSIYEAANIIEYDNLAGILIVSNSAQVVDLDVCPQITGPFTEETFLSVVDTCLRYTERFASMRSKIQKLQDKLESRKLVDKAKGILMDKLEISEEQAYRRLQKLSMDRSQPMKDIAKTIIQADGEGS